jgi:hypothetical protein
MVPGESVLIEASRSAATAPVQDAPLPRRMMREPSPLALRVAYAGLVPFVGCAMLVWIVAQPDAHDFVAFALSAYAALIVSFLGGVHWGFAFRQVQPDPMLFVWGVVPSILAWVALLMPPYAGLVVHGAMLVVCYARDRSVYPREGAAGWLALRLRLTLVAATACFIGAAGVGS